MFQPESSHGRLQVRDIFGDYTPVASTSCITTSTFQNLTLLSALPVTRLFLSGLRCAPHICPSCASITSTKVELGRSYSSSLPSLVPNTTILSPGRNALHNANPQSQVRITLPVRTFQTLAPPCPAESSISSSEEIAKVRISERCPERRIEDVKIDSGSGADLVFVGGSGTV